MSDVSNEGAQPTQSSDSHSTGAPKTKRTIRLLPGKKAKHRADPAGGTRRQPAADTAPGDAVDAVPPVVPPVSAAAQARASREGVIHIDSQPAEVQNKAPSEGPLYAATQDRGLRRFKRDTRYTTGFKINRPRRLRRFVFGFAVLVLVAAIGFGVWWAIGRSEGDDGPETTTTAPAGERGARADTADAAPPAQPRPPEQLPVVSRVDTAEPVVFVTIEDGYHVDPRVRDLIARHSLPVTAMVIADAALADNAEFWRSLRAIGVDFENHSASHANYRDLTAEAQAADVCAASDAVEATTGQRPVLVRAPFGAVAPDTRTAVAGCGAHALVGWSIELRDGTWHVPPEKPGLEAGDIVLMQFTPTLYDELNMLLAEMQARGLRPARLRDWIGPEAESAR